MNQALDLLRDDYRRRSGRSMALPLAGTVVWTAVGCAGAVLPAKTAALVLLFGSGVIFPLGLLFGRLLGEDVMGRENPLARLMGAAVLMVNLLWPIHILFYLRDPSSLPLTVGIGLGIHWLVFGWIVQHPAGAFHAVTRTLLVAAVWIAFPAARFVAVSAVVVAVYLATLAWMARAPRPAPLAAAA
jgi:hypothetical protein